MLTREQQVSERQLRLYGVRMKIAGGETEFAVVVSYDVSERIRREHQLAVLAEAATLTRSAPSTATVVEVVTAMMCRHFGSIGCFAADVLAERSELINIFAFVRQRRLSCTLPSRISASPLSMLNGWDAWLQTTLELRSFVLVLRIRDSSLTALFAVRRAAPKFHRSYMKTWLTFRCRATEPACPIR